MSKENTQDKNRKKQSVEKANETLTTALRNLLGGADELRLQRPRVHEVRQLIMDNVAIISDVLKVEV